jgi:hypothetical protein
VHPQAYYRCLISALVSREGCKLHCPGCFFFRKMKTDLTTYLVNNITVGRTVPTTLAPLKYVQVSHVWFTWVLARPMQCTVFHIFRSTQRSFQQINIRLTLWASQEQGEMHLFNEALGRVAINKWVSYTALDCTY